MDQRYPTGTRFPQREDVSDALFSCLDPLDRRIILTTQQWHDHILPGHPELNAHLTFVEWCVTKPESIRYDRINPLRESFYIEHRIENGRRLALKVVCHFDDTVVERFGHHGFVVTAYLVGMIDRREEERWAL